MKLPLNFLNPASRKKIGDTTDYHIVPVGFSSSFEEYNALGIQQPKNAITFQQMRVIAEKSVWVDVAIRAIADVIGSLSWQIVPKKQYLHLFAKDEGMQMSRRHLEFLFTLPNATMTTLSDVLKSVVRDLLIMDAGVIELVRLRNEESKKGMVTDKKGRIVCPIARDAGTFYIDHDEHQVHRRYVQVGMKGRQAMPMAEDNLIFNIDIGGSFAVFDRNDIIYMRMHPKSGSAYGSPPITTLMSSINADLSADANIGRFMATGGIVPGFIAADETLDPKVVKRYEDAFRRIQRAGAREIPIISGAGKTSFVPIAASSKEMEQNQLQNYYMKKILAMYKVSPSVLGMSDGTNRAVVFAQNDNFMAGAITPLKIYLENIITERIVSEFDYRLRFEFLEPNASDKQSRYEEIQVRKQLGMIDDVEAYVLAGVEPPQKESPAIIMSDLQVEQAKAQLELSKLQIAQLALQLESTKIQIDNQAEQMKQQGEAQQQQAQQQMALQQQQQAHQQKMQQRQQLQSMGGMSPFDAMKEAQQGGNFQKSITGPYSGPDMPGGLAAGPSMFDASGIAQQRESQDNKLRSRMGRLGIGPIQSVTPVGLPAPSDEKRDLNKPALTQREHGDIKLTGRKTYKNSEGKRIHTEKGNIEQAKVVTAEQQEAQRKPKSGLGSLIHGR